MEHRSRSARPLVSECSPFRAFSDNVERVPLHLSAPGRGEGQCGNVFDSTISKSALAELNERRLARMCQVLRSKLGLFDCCVDLGGEGVEGALQRGRGGA